ncbi:hypothetical protein GCM10025331_14890 [Actinoplanes utahensis]|nr:hypothetical protein Aut01nite_22100 [Actinoplanes utahensis]
MRVILQFIAPPRLPLLPKADHFPTHDEPEFHPGKPIIDTTRPDSRTTSPTVRECAIQPREAHFRGTRPAAPNRTRPSSQPDAAWPAPSLGPAPRHPAASPPVPNTADSAPEPAVGTGAGCP